MAADSKQRWFPGSFTKNFSWGPKGDGLKQLHEAIKVGFDGQMADVPRSEFRSRVTNSGRIDFIPANFFLFNQQQAGTDWIVADELVYQALNFKHSDEFDKLALFAFNLSLAGKWRGAKTYQRYPALWSKYFLIETIGQKFNWDSSNISAKTIEKYFQNDPRYQAQTTTKLSTNLNYLYHNGNLLGFKNSVVERWWVSALFLALDRAIEDRKIDGKISPENSYNEILASTLFHSISGSRSLEKDLAVPHIIELYSACGSRERFDDDATLERTSELIPNSNFLPNSNIPFGAVHASNPNIVKILPRACAMLAVYAGYTQIDLEELEDFDVMSFVETKTFNALNRLKELGIRSTISVKDLMRLTRDK